MTTEISTLKQLYADNRELKKLYANNQLVWKRASAWRRQLDLYPRAVRNDGEGNLYVLASSKVQSTGKPDQLKMIKLTSDGEIIFSIDLKKLETNADYSQKGFVIVDGYIYISIYKYVFQLNAIDGTLVSKIDTSKNGNGYDFSKIEYVENNFVMTKYLTQTSLFCIYTKQLSFVKSFNLGEDGFIDAKTYENVWYGIDSYATTYLDKSFSPKNIFTLGSLYPYAFDRTDTSFYLINQDSILKYDATTFKQIWKIGVPTGSYRGSLFIVKDQIVVENEKGFFVYDGNDGRLMFSKMKTSQFPIFSNKLLAVLEDKYFCRLAYDEKAVYKLELGDEDNYENLN